MDQQKALSGGHPGMPGEHGQTILEHEESEEEDIDCEWEMREIWETRELFLW